VLAPHPSGIRRYLLLTRPLVCLELENVRGDRQRPCVPGARAKVRLARDCARNLVALERLTNVRSPDRRTIAVIDIGEGADEATKEVTFARYRQVTQHGLVVNTAVLTALRSPDDTPGVMPTRTSQLQIRVTPREKALLRREAARAGLDVSAYVLGRALPTPATAWDALLASLGRADSPDYVLAELNVLLTELAPIEFKTTVARGPSGGLEPWVLNYVAALVEQAATRKGVSTPDWCAEVAPLGSPWFGTDLRRLRPYLLRVSPVPFKRRNLFIDSGIGSRV
jgi:hypothetical protein